MGLFRDFYEQVIEPTFEDLADIGEYATKGFSEEVIKGNGHYETSNEKNWRARDIAYNAEQRVEDKSDELRNAIELLNEELTELHNKKIEITKKIETQLVTENDKIKFSGIHFNNYDGGSFSDSKYASANLLSIFGGVGGFVGQGIRINMANEALEDAKDFDVEASKKVAEINRLLAAVTKVRNNIVEVSELLSIFYETAIGVDPQKGKQALDIMKCLLEDELSEEIGTLSQRYTEEAKMLRSYVNRI